MGAFDHTNIHPIPSDPLHVPVIAIDGINSPQHVETCKRLIRAYKATMAQRHALKSIAAGDLWSHIVEHHFGEMLAIIENEDAEKLSGFLTHFGRDYVWFGGVATGIDGSNYWDTSLEGIAFSYFDKLVCLAEAIGVLPVENPENGEKGNWGKNIRVAPNEIAEAISKTLGIAIAPPTGIIPVVGINTTQGPIHYRHINALYLAMRIFQMIGAGGRIAEFGGGIGLAAYYLRGWGQRDITLYDIPVTNMLSGFFLIGALGQDAVCLEGEPMHEDRIKIRAGWNCTEAPDRHFKLVANQDAFPEMNRLMFDAYVREIKRTSKFLLHINTEAGPAIQQVPVAKILNADNELSRVARSPYWLRRGYVEEVYLVK
jgi:hypothetical protein